MERRAADGFEACVQARGRRAGKKSHASGMANDFIRQTGLRFTPLWRARLPRRVTLNLEWKMEERILTTDFTDLTDSKREIKKTKSAFTFWVRLQILITLLKSVYSVQSVVNHLPFDYWPQRSARSVKRGSPPRRQERQV